TRRERTHALCLPLVQPLAAKTVLSGRRYAILGPAGVLQGRGRRTNVATPRAKATSRLNRQTLP
ncbi:MAG: hypothetical protein ACYCVM_09540, partial [Acidiferrobacter sp.]